MKILTPEEEAAHNRETWKGGTIGATAGLAAGVLGVYGASLRFPAFRQLTVPIRVFLATASMSFGGVITADRYSRAFERTRHADYGYQDSRNAEWASAHQAQPFSERVKTFVSEQRYPIVYGSWVASMIIAFALVGRHPTLTTQQKLVQARVYAQGLTLAVLIASFALEGNDLRSGKGRWETVKVVDPDDPEHKRVIEKQVHHESYQGEDQWMDMVAAEERKMKAKGEKVRKGEGKNNKSEDKKEGEQQQQNQKGEAKEGGEKQQQQQEKKSEKESSSSSSSSSSKGEEKSKGEKQSK